MQGRNNRDVQAIGVLAQQAIYSGHFTRYLCALMSNLPTNSEVLELAENLFEELGFAPDSPQPHYEIYSEMLEHFQVDLNSTTPLPETLALIQCMYSHCRDTNPAVGLGALCLGAEGLVSKFYTDIVSGFTAHGVDSSHIKFFQIHIECDDEHALTLSKMLHSRIIDDHRNFDVIKVAGTALVDARYKFLSSIMNIENRANHPSLVEA
jgi:pyrroloquinoline-quinone synthase